MKNLKVGQPASMRAQSLSRVQLFATPMDCRPPDSSIHRILQETILEWGAMPFSSGSFQSRHLPAAPALQVDSSPLSHRGSPILLLPTSKVTSIKCQFSLETVDGSEKSLWKCWSLIKQPVAHLELVYLVTALVPSDTACLASSPGSSRRTAVWISLDVMVERLL